MGGVVNCQENNVCELGQKSRSGQGYNLPGEMIDKHLSIDDQLIAEALGHLLHQRSLEFYKDSKDGTNKNFEE